MRTRRANYGATEEEASCIGIKESTRSAISAVTESPPRCAKRARFSSLKGGGKRSSDPSSKGSFDKLPDDLLLSILVCLSSRADSPKDLLSIKATCKRFNKLACSCIVMSKASEGALRVRASHWCAAASAYLSNCADAGNMEACFTLGMIRFYCLMERKGGLEMLARAAARSHAGALHALGVIQFNGSGGSRADKNLKAGVHLCARAAALSHVDAMRELGHCLQDGYGVPKNVINGRRLILEANVREAASTIKCLRSNVCLGGGVNKMKLKGDSLSSMYKLIHSRGCYSLLSDFGCSVLSPDLHIAHVFLLDWFHTRPPPPSLRLCSHANCGRLETRKHEFRRCSACGHVNYCSRACQALDWKIQHKLYCVSAFRWQNRAIIGLPRGVDPLQVDDSGDQ